MFPLKDLPDLCLQNVIHFLDMRTVLALRKSCSFMCDFITENHSEVAPLLAFRKIFWEEFDKSLNNQLGMLQFIFKEL
jgi:hypothetical protein